MDLKKARVLVVDDDPDVLTAVHLLLKTEVASIHTEQRPDRLPDLLRSPGFDVVLLDMNFRAAVNSGNEGLYWLRKIRECGSPAPVIMVTAYADIDLAVRSLKEGASDFLVKPWHNQRLIDTVRDAVSKPSASASRQAAGLPQSRTPGQSSLLGESKVMQELFTKLHKVAPTDANVLLLGENGTGKDMIARAIHEQSLRARGPYIKVDVGALSDTLFESELFGHEKGAFTDAREQRVGRFEAAGGGTLFLDEIGNIDLRQQARLLSVLQNRQVTRLGSVHLLPVDIRLVCATNLPVRELADETRFRKDLVYRINTVEIFVPPLRERGEDILLLAGHFCDLYAGKYMKGTLQLAPAARDKLMHYSFPGNVRELQYVLERAVIMSEGEVLGADELIFSSLEHSPDDATGSRSPGRPLSAVEREAILQTIQAHQGNITRAARSLGLTRTALYRRMSKYDI